MAQLPRKTIQTVPAAFLLHFILTGMLLALFGILTGCKEVIPPAPKKIGARLMEEGSRLMLVLHNYSVGPATICRANVYDAAASLDIRRYPDTGELPPEKVFGTRATAPKGPIITVSDFVTLAPGQEIRVPVDLSGILNGCKLGDSVFVSVFFKNIDPFICSKVEVEKSDKATQDYCRLLHCVPMLSCSYWAGEVRTPYYCVGLCVYAPPKARQRPREVIVRMSRAHPIRHRVFR